MQNAALTISAGRSVALRTAVLFLGFLILQCFSFSSPVQAQIFKPEKFDKSILEDSLRDQEFLREEMLIEQEILREEMEQIRQEIQRIMKEITLAMKEEALKLKAELEGLQLETKSIQKELLGILEQSKNDFIAGKEEMQKELQNMREEAKILTKDIKQVLEDQKEVWALETAALKDSLVEARKEMESAKVDSAEVLKETRSAFSDLKTENDFNMAEMRAESSATLSEAGDVLKKSQQDYKQESQGLSAELKAGMSGARQAMQQGQREQRRDAVIANSDVVAALKIGKKKRLAELKTDSKRKRLQSKRDLRSGRKRTLKQKRTQSVEQRQALLDRSKKDRRRAARRVTPGRRVERKPVSREEEVQRQFGEPGLRKVEELPAQEETGADEAEVIVASLPDASTETAEDSPQKQLTQFSKNITDLKQQIKKSKGNPGTLLAKLGDAYLEAQRFMDSETDDQEKQSLLELSGNRDLLLGSYEQAAWAYKLALTFDRKSAETHLKIGEIYDEMEDGQNALMFAKLAHQIFKKSRNLSQMEKTQSYIDSLTAKYESPAEKKLVPKG
jgi:hypothetical protein